MQRGEVVPIADRSAGERACKLRPAVVVQSDLFHAAGSITVAPLSGCRADAPLLRLKVETFETVPLQHTSFVMVDKLTTSRHEHAGQVIGRLTREDVVRLDDGLAVFLGLG